MNLTRGGQWHPEVRASQGRVERAGQERYAKGVRAHVVPPRLLLSQREGAPCGGIKAQSLALYHAAGLQQLSMTSLPRDMG